MPLINSLGALKQLPGSSVGFPARDGIIAGNTNEVQGTIETALFTADGNMFLAGSLGQVGYLSKFSSNANSFSSQWVHSEPVLSINNNAPSVFMCAAYQENINTIFVGGSKYANTSSNYLSGFIYEITTTSPNNSTVWDTLVFNGQNATANTPVYNASVTSILSDDASTVTTKINNILPSASVYTLLSGSGTLNPSMNSILKQSLYLDPIGTHTFSANWVYGLTWLGIGGKLVFWNSSTLIVMLNAYKEPEVPYDPSVPKYAIKFYLNRSTGAVLTSGTYSIKHPTKDTNTIDIAVSPNTSRYILGTVSDTIGSTQGRYFIYRYGSSPIGYPQWQKYITDTVNIVDTHGSMVATNSYIYINIAIDSTTNLYIKLNAINGGLIWSRKLSGLLSNTSIDSIIRDENLNLFGTNQAGKLIQIGMPTNGSMPNDGIYVVDGITYTYTNASLTIQDSDVVIANMTNFPKVAGGQTMANPPYTTSYANNIPWTRTSTSGL